MADIFRVRLDEAIAEVDRELRMRIAFYPERVRDRKMSRLVADSQTNRMEAARDFLIELRKLRGGNYEQQGSGGPSVG